MVRSSARAWSPPPSALGLYSATRRAYLKDYTIGAERLERERDQQQELATAAERARITREMHDIVAHHPCCHDRAQRRCSRRLGRDIPAGGHGHANRLGPPDARPWPTPADCSADRRPMLDMTASGSHCRI